jgi:hypothetical protein
VATGEWLAMARRVAIFVAIVLAVPVRGQQWPDQRVSSVANEGMKLCVMLIVDNYACFTA